MKTTIITRRLFVAASGLLLLSLLILVNPPSSLRAVEDLPGASSVETQLSEVVRAPGVTTVVHFWAPWCPNCRAELGAKDGWGDFIRTHPETRFAFVTVWHEGKDGRDALERAGVAGLPNVTLLQDANPSRGEDRTRAFLGLPMTWIPTTWVFREGKLRYALNYGEVRFPMLGQMIEDSASAWSHK